MARLKATTFLRLSIKQQLRFMLKIINFTDLQNLFQELTQVNPILSVDASGRFTLHSDREIFTIGKTKI